MIILGFSIGSLTYPLTFRVSKSTASGVLARRSWTHI